MEEGECFQILLFGTLSYNLYSLGDQHKPVELGRLEQLHHVSAIPVSSLQRVAQMFAV